MHPWCVCQDESEGLKTPTNQSICAIVLFWYSGTNVQEAKRILSASGLPITSAIDLEDAAKKAVAAIAKK